MTKHYPLQLVGEQYYQPAIGRCRIGEIVDVCIEQGNPADPLALVVRRRNGGETLGYVATDSFVRRVIHEDGEGVAASIGTIVTGRRGFYEVSLLVSVIDEPADIVRYRPAEASNYEAPAQLAAPVEASFKSEFGCSPLQLIGAVIILFALVRCMA